LTTSSSYRYLEHTYTNGIGVNIGEELIRTCLLDCKLYRRGTAFFSSNSLKSYADLISDLIEKEVKLEIMCSPVIQDNNLIKILDKNSTEKQRETLLKEAENILIDAVGGFIENPDNTDYRSKVLSYMIAKGQLEIKFAIPKDYETLPTDGHFDPIYHVKNGYFDFPNDDRIIFAGSFNESRQGHAGNREFTSVFKSWEPGHKGFLKPIEDMIDQEWNEEESVLKDLKIYPLNEEILEIIKKLAPKTPPIKPVGPGPGTTPPIVIEEFPLWDHQIEAIDTFLESKHGVLEMATGTGKTTTALEIVKRLYKDEKIDSVIISTYGNTLLSQWVEEVQEWKNRQPKIDNRCASNFKVYKDFDTQHDMNSFLSAMKDSILIISRNATKLRNLLSRRKLQSNKSKLLIIHDEIHGFGSNSIVENLEGSHEGIQYKLGLSATPEREYDERGSEFIKNEIGESIFHFGIEEAIQEGILCEFNYHPLEFFYTTKDTDKIKSIFARRNQCIKEGKKFPKEQLYRELSNIRKKAVNKPKVLGEFLSLNQNLIKSSIFFVQDKEQGKDVIKILNKYTKRIHLFVEGSPDVFIKLLDSNQIDAVVACERLNEGVDIRSLNNIFLVATPRAKLVTIQRMGRCLRIDPKNKNKKSNIIDFILNDNKEPGEDENGEIIIPADEDRKLWISEYSKVKKKKKGK
jgi:superfamily II DNA or RNA helicase